MARVKMVRIAAWVVALLVGLPALAYAGLVAVNWNDEAPSAEAERLVALYRDRPEVADADNGHVQLQNLVNEEGADYRSARSAAVAPLASACNEPERCAGALEADPAALAQWLESERWLLERYRRALATTGWREEVPQDPAAPLPGYQPALDAQLLHLLDAHRLARDGDAAAVRELLERDLVFWRRAVASSDLLVTKLIAVAAAGRNFEFGNLALRQLPSDLVETALPPSWREPLTLPERSMARTMSGEWHFSTGVLRTASSPVPGQSAYTLRDRLARPLLQEQATLNLMAERMVRMGELSELPWPELAPAVDRLLEEPAPPGFRLYNPVGTMLESIQPPGMYVTYLVRVSDLEGRRRAALLVATLRAAGVGAAEAGAAVAEASLRNPYDGTAFEWDAASGSVVFDGMEEGERGRHAVLL